MCRATQIAHLRRHRGSATDVRKVGPHRHLAPGRTVGLFRFGKSPHPAAGLSVPQRAGFGARAYPEHQHVERRQQDCRSYEPEGQRQHRDLSNDDNVIWMAEETVFSAVFLLFAERRQALATTLAGILAVLAPTVGSIVGGWIPETFSWRWLFLINIAPGIVAAVGAALLLSRERAQRRLWQGLDLIGLGLLAIALAALEIGLKETPGRDRVSPLILGLLILSATSLAAFVRRMLRSRRPLVELRRAIAGGRPTNGRGRRHPRGDVRRTPHRTARSGDSGHPGAHGSEAPLVHAINEAWSWLRC